MPFTNYLFKRSTTGNTGTSSGTNFLGTTDNASLRFRTFNAQGIVLDSLGNVGIGSSPTFTAGAARDKLLVDAGSSTNPTPTGAYNIISGKGYLDNYLQLNIQNRAATDSASSDIVASNDAATEAINYIDMGINSSGNTSTGVLGGVNTGYLYSTGNDFAIGNATSGRTLNFFTGGTASVNERMRIDGAGNVGIGLSNPSYKLSVLATNPLYLSGVQAGTNTSADSILTITNGVVKKIPATTYISSNSGTGTGIQSILKTSVTTTPGVNVSQSSSQIITVTVTGATVNGTVIVNPRSPLPNTVFIAYSYVSAANTVSINFIATAGGGTSLGTLNLDISVIQ